MNPLRARKRKTVLKILLAVGASALLGRFLWSWGAVYGFNHHSYLLGVAYAKLEQDPAFKGKNKSNFPTLAQMQGHEGVSWLSSATVFGGEGTLTGPGPDSKGKSPYAWHYYNPNIPDVGQRGGAPQAVADHYDSLKGGLIARSRTSDGTAPGGDLNKTAAWFAHFVADMSCPYHLNGMGVAEALSRIKNNQMQYDPMYWGAISSVYTDWKSEFDTWKALYDADSKVDWFDPWYYDGTYAAKASHSTHVEWEANWSAIQVNGTRTGYSSLFLEQQKKGGNGNEANFVEFIKNVADETKKQQTAASPVILKLLGTEVADLLDQAAQNIYTGWRASFSALQPDFTIKADPQGGGDKLVVKIKNLEGKETARGVKVTVSITKGTIKGPATADAGDIAPGEEKEIQKWEVEKDNPNATDAKITIEVTGTFTETPDSGKSVLEKSLSNLTPTVVLITPSLRDEQKKIWLLEVEVKDGKGTPVTTGDVKFTATGGSFLIGSDLLEWQKGLNGGKAEKAWVQTDDKKQTITVRYLGDESDPTKPDTKYEESEASIDLPPELLEASTVFVVDATGSMRGAKLASAKEAVRNALAQYVGKANTEEWALYAFFDCGICSLLQGFTTDPSEVTARLGFEAAGSTPIAYSLQVASNYLRKSARGKKGRIILLSDGGENCSGKPVDAAESISQRKVFFDLNIKMP
jgi:hypothetical protein